ncbi:hypothetical protein [Leucobacter soli]|uniref:hypothetical protein n=1 Tax=Leucobacter soli TaxID=2812850 RepID=UPI003608935E
MPASDQLAEFAARFDDNLQMHGSTLALPRPSRRRSPPHAATPSAPRSESSVPSNCAPASPP